MKSFLNKLRLQFFYASKSLGYGQDSSDIFYKIYLNHNKIIHWRDGYPVYSISLPPLYSKSAANLIARQIFRIIQNKNTPNLMSFAVNDDCDAACEHCSFFTGVDDKKRQVLNLEECKKLISDAQEIGVSAINFVGGEPLLRDDLLDIIKSVDKNYMSTFMFTNGSLLEEKALDLKKAGLGGLYVSLDSAEPRKHDLFRRKKGLFEKAMKGINKAKKAGLTTGISCSITPQSFKDGELDRIIELGRKIGVHEIMVFDAMPTGRFKLRKDLIDNPGWVDEIIQVSRKYNRDNSYPGVLVWGYATSHRSVGCVCGTSYCYVSPYGDIMSCDFNHAIFGNIKDEPFYKIWDRLTNRSEFKKAKWGGCKVKDSEYLSSSAVSTGNGCCS